MADNCGANKVGVKRIMLSITDCDTGDVFGPFAHDQAGDDLPKILLADEKIEGLTAGYVKITRTNPTIEVNIIRKDGLNPALYQSARYGFSGQFDYYNGDVCTFFRGSNSDVEASDTHEVMLKLIFKKDDITYLVAGDLAA